jgi:dynein heavy chain
MEGVCILFGEKPDWANSKKLLSDMKFLENVQGYDKDNIIPKRKTELKKHLDNNPDIVVDKVTGVSSAAGALAGWLHAMIM